MKRIAINFILVLFISSVTAQSTKFNYRSPLSNVTSEDWYSIQLPPDLFQKTNKDFSDIRLFAVTEKDTVEIPYLLKIRTDEITTENFTLPLLNQSRANGALFFTVQIPAGKMLNTLNLNFVERNFDALVSIEGGTDRKEWFEIVNNKRIVSIYQDQIDYSNTTVNFPTSDYTFLRIQVKSDKQISLSGASFNYINTKKGERISLTDLKTTTTTEHKQTEIRIRAPYRTAVNTLALSVSHTTDYYRTYSLAYALDSIKTEKGWIQNYSTVKQGYLTSLDSNKISFETLITHELKLTIYNQDNPALTINNLELSGPKIEIIAKLSPQQNIFLYYGNTKLSPPRYDLIHFEDRIPQSIKTIGLLKEENLESPQQEKALFTKKFWLWTILIVVIGIMGYFTLQMLSRKN
ncbi:MAG TPA: hypothetical protein PLV21_16290 [Cyclobacteriaceae bacterium]|nr:hypothetical protein [Cyclobacteriaceae bacterium]